MFLKKSPIFILQLFGPIIWGGLTWLFAFGPMARYLHIFGSFSYQVNFLARSLVGLLVFYLLFRNKIEWNKKESFVSFFNYTIPLPSLSFLTLIVFSGILVSFFFRPLWEFPILNSLVLAVLISAFFEELFTHTIFCIYQFNISTFLIFNLFSSVLFGLMHAGYSPIGYTQLFQFAFNEHIPFSFLLGIIAYQTKRIEIPIILHMISNAIYPLFLAFGSSVPPFMNYLKLIIFISIIGFRYTSYKDKK